MVATVPHAPAEIEVPMEIGPKAFRAKSDVNELTYPVITGQERYYDMVSRTAVCYKNVSKVWWKRFFLKIECSKAGMRP